MQSYKAKTQNIIRIYYFQDFKFRRMQFLAQFRGFSEINFAKRYGYTYRCVYQPIKANELAPGPYGFSSHYKCADMT
jgi:hypothetical protein